MKAYTDLEQSKKLAEILQHESADMWYWEWPTTPQYNNYERPMPHKGEGIVNVPCWSLAALLEVLPHRIDEIYDLDFGKPSANEGWYVCYGDVDYFDKYYIANSNLIDACYEMILKLHEEKRL